MTEFETIMEANTKPARTRRKPPMEPKERLFLDKVRDVRLSLLDGLQTLVVVSHHRAFEDIFVQYTPSMKLYAKKSTLVIKTIDEVTAEDLDSWNFIELDKD